LKSLELLERVRDLLLDLEQSFEFSMLRRERMLELRLAVDRWIETECRSAAGPRLTPRE
jgi:hypothetical protein